MINILTPTEIRKLGKYNFLGIPEENKCLGGVNMHC
jgi:hypothetical protein